MNGFESGGFFTVYIAYFEDNKAMFYVDYSILIFIRFILNIYIIRLVATVFQAPKMAEYLLILLYSLIFPVRGY